MCSILIDQVHGIKFSVDPFRRKIVFLEMRSHAHTLTPSSQLYETIEMCIKQFDRCHSTTMIILSELKLKANLQLI